jgi:hypothetical protein
VDQGPLVTEMIDAGAGLVRRFDAEYKPLQAAFWLKDYEDGQWFLHLASDQIDDSNFDLAYGEVIRLLDRRSHLWLDPFQVKVMGTDVPLVRSVLDIQQKYPGLLPTRLRSPRLGGATYQEAFIYALPIPATAE